MVEGAWPRRLSYPWKAARRASPEGVSVIEVFAVVVLRTASLRHRGGAARLPKSTALTRDGCLIIAAFFRGRGAFGCVLPTWAKGNPSAQGSLRVARRSTGA